MKNDEFASQLSEAFELHQANQLDAAEGRYRKLLAVNANSFDVLHLLGLICFQTERYEEADTLMSKALAYNPSSADAASNHGLVLLKLGQPEAALKRLATAVRLAQKSSSASANYALALLDLGRFEEALLWSEKAQKKFPDSVDIQRHIAGALFKLSRFNDAAKRYQALLERFPNDHQSMLGLAACYIELDRPNEAARYMADVLSLDPGNAEALLFEANRLEELGELEAALLAIDQALQVAPRVARFHAARARILGKQERHQDALNACDAALELEPDLLDALFCKGVARQAVHDFDGAIEEYKHIIALDAENPFAHWNQAYCNLTLGRLRIGFEGYEWRLRNPLLGHSPRFFEAPLWLGQFPLGGARILLHSEQGFGDTFQFLRYVATLRQQGATVLLEVPRAVRPLLKSWVPEELLLETGQSVPSIDAHCPLPSLPLACGTTEDTIPADTPYLFSEPALVEQWSLILGPKADLRIGVVWSGNQQHVNDRNRSIPLNVFLEAFPTEVQLVALQKELRDEDHQTMLQNPRISFYGEQIKDFADTAALIELVDLVVTIDTGTAHLAAAMNKRTWILLDTVSDWRWQLKREDSPWYPAVRLIRQGPDAKWQPVMQQVSRALTEMLPPKKGLLSLFSRRR